MQTQPRPRRAHPPGPLASGVHAAVRKKMKTPPPILASDVLREDLAPIEPGRNASRLWDGGCGVALPGRRSLSPARPRRLPARAPSLGNLPRRRGCERRDSAGSLPLPLASGRRCDGRRCGRHPGPFWGRAACAAHRPRFERMGRDFAHLDVHRTSRGASFPILLPSIPSRASSARRRVPRRAALSHSRRHGHDERPAGSPG